MLPAEGFVSEIYMGGRTPLHDYFLVAALGTLLTHQLSITSQSHLHVLSAPFEQCIHTFMRHYQ